MKANFQVITLFGELIQNLFAEGVVGQAIQKGQIGLSTINPRKFSTDVHHTVDDRPFGGGDGMVMLASNLQLSMAEAIAADPEASVIYLSPQGERLDDQLVRALAEKPRLVLICGRYAGVDQRFLVKNKIREISIGDYVLSGGELAAAVIIDAVARQTQGVLGHAQSAEAESFHENLLEAPQFTRPREWQGLSVPEVLTSGNHAKIEEWQKAISRFVTFVKRPDLKPFEGLNEKQKSKLLKILNELTASEKAVLGLVGFDEQLKLQLNGQARSQTNGPVKSRRDR